MIVVVSDNPDTEETADQSGLGRGKGIETVAAAQNLDVGGVADQGDRSGVALVDKSHVFDGNIKIYHLAGMIQVVLIDKLNVGRHDVGLLGGLHRYL